MPQNQRICLFGGAFDPPHLGHLMLAETARERLSLDRVVFLPTGAPALKERTLSDSRHRVAMTELAIADNPAFAVDARETRKDGVSYTINTVREMRKEHQNAVLFFLLGADRLADLHKWRESQALVREIQFVAALRPPCDMRVFDSLSKNFAADVVEGIRSHALAMPQLDISSTDLRTRASEGRSLRYLTPDAVGEYIVKHGLYGSGRYTAHPR